MDNRTAYLKAIQEEIANDPTGRGYAGRTPEEQMRLLNEPYDKEVVTRLPQIPRIAEIINQIAQAPNIATVEDIADAQTTVDQPQPEPVEPQPEPQPEPVTPEEGQPQ